MARPHVYPTEAVVLRRTDFGEADRILTLFTPAYGKLHAIAKGVRRVTSRKAGHLEPFTPTQLLLASGRDLEIITQAEAHEPLEALRGDLWHATAAWYTAELIDRFVEDADPHPRLYALFVETLCRLDAGALGGTVGRSWLALRYFEVRLLGELGYRPGLHSCTSCDTPLRPEENGFSAATGGALCPACLAQAERRLSLRALKVLRLLQTAPWAQVPALRIDGALRGEIEAAMQSLLCYHLDRELTTWAFLQGMPTSPRS